MPLLPTHKILPDINTNGHPANVISITTVTGLNSNTVQSAIEEINLNIIENSNTIILAYNQANAAFDKANNIVIDPNISNTANLALVIANSAYDQANAAFAKANTADSSFAYNQANAAFDKANTAYNIAVLNLMGF